MPTIEIKKTILMPTKKVMSLVVTATVKRSNPSPNPNCKNGQNQNSGIMTTMMTSFLLLALRVTPKVNTFSELSGNSALLTQQLLKFTRRSGR